MAWTACSKYCMVAEVFLPQEKFADRHFDIIYPAMQKGN